MEQLKPSAAYRDDQELAERVAAGDEAAIRVMATRLLERVRTTVQYVSAGDRDQDDWVQLSLLEILRSARTYRGESSLEKWADRIVFRTSLRELKKRRGRERVVALDPDARPTELAENDDATALHLVRRHVAGILGRVSEAQRMVVVLRLVHGYSIAEIAEMTDTPANTVRDRLQVGRRKLREKMTKDQLLRSWIRSRKP